MYVGIAGGLKNRVIQHLVRRDSSVTTGTSAVVLNPDYVTEVWWWEHPDFAERHVSEAAELVAFDVLDPALSSRGAIQARARELYADDAFREKMGALCSSQPSGRLVIQTFQDTLQRMAEIERRLDALDRWLERQG